MFSFSKPTPVGEVLSDEDDDDIVGVPARRISMGSIGRYAVRSPSSNAHIS